MYHNPAKEIEERKSAQKSVLSDPINWLSSEEEAAFRKSGCPRINDWILSEFGLTSEEFIQRAREGKKIPASPPSEQFEDLSRLKKATSVFTAKKKKEPDKPLLGDSYECTSVYGEKITITQILRPLKESEENQHKFWLCENSENRTCIDIAIGRNWLGYSCIKCAIFQKELLSKKSRSYA